MALTRAGRRDEGATVTKRFQELRESLYKTQFGQTYLEQGRYAEALASTGAEAELVDKAAPAIVVRERRRGPSRRRSAAARGLGRPVLVDAFGDGQLDLLLAGADGVRLLRNEGGRFTDVTEAVGPRRRRKAGAAVAGDLDNDGKADLLLLAPLALLRNEGGALQGRGALRACRRMPTRRSPPWPTSTTTATSTSSSGRPRQRPAGSCATTATSPSPTSRRSRSWGPAGGPAPSSPPTSTTGATSTSFVGRADGPPVLFKNRRDGSFEDVAAEVGLVARRPRPWPSGDVNKDGYTDFFLAGAKGAWLAASNGRGAFAPVGGSRRAPRGPARRSSWTWTPTASSTSWWEGRSASRCFATSGASSRSSARRPRPGAVASLVAADLDQDGDVDLVAAGPDGSVRVLRNDGGNRNRSVRVALTGRVSNRTGIGAKVELRAGSLRQKLETYASTPAVAPDDVVFGLGAREAADVVRVIWTSGIVQTETEFPAAAKGETRTAALQVTELDRKPCSCPYLFAWNGSRFEFVTDFLGGGEMGYWLGPGERNTPDPDEYVRLTGDQLVAKDGRFELRVTNELEEALFLDHVHLRGDRPSPGRRGASRRRHDPRAAGLPAVRGPRPAHARAPSRTTVATGPNAAARLDRRLRRGLRPSAHPRLCRAPRPRPRPRRGSRRTTPCSCSPPGPTTRSRATTWPRPSAGWSLEPPALEVEDAAGAWQPALHDVGIPVGRPQTIALDLSGVPFGPSRRLRLVTNMRVYWDRIARGRPGGRCATTAGASTPLRADLQERGFSAEVAADGRAALQLRLRAASPSPRPGSSCPAATRAPGDVRELLAGVDDLFVVSRPGDEVALSFDATALGPLAAGLDPHLPSLRRRLQQGDGHQLLEPRRGGPAALPRHEVLPLPAGGGAGAAARRNARSSRATTRAWWAGPSGRSELVAEVADAWNPSATPPPPARPTCRTRSRGPTCGRTPTGSWP